MSEKELLALFIDSLTEKEIQYLSFPMNSQLDKMFTSFKRGFEVGKTI